MKENGKIANFAVLMSIYAGSNADHFRVSLTSIFEQTVLPKQLIIVKDGPVSNAVEKIILEFTQKYENIELKIISFPNNVGLGLALAQGVVESDYELIARMDSDDIAVKERFEIQLRMFEDNNDLDIIGGQLLEFSNQVTQVSGQRRVPLSHNEIVQFAKRRSPFNHPTVMFKKTSVISIGNYGDFRGFEDYDLWIRAINHGLHFENTDKQLIYMRVGDGLYARRGGLKYLKQYFKLKNCARKQGVNSIWDMLYCDVLMVLNVVVPSKLREQVYKKLLHT